MAYLSLPGTSGSFASAPYRSEYNEANILDSRVEVDLDSFAGALMTRWSGVAASSVFQFYLSGKTPIAQVRQDLSVEDTVVNDAAFTMTTGTRTQLRVTFDVPSAQVKFYQRATGTALTDDSGWTQVGSTGTLPDVTSIAQPTETAINVGASNASGNSLMSTGKFYRAVLKKGAVSGGTLVLDANFEDTTTWTFA